ncbi:hypothetical protein VNO78_03663 [Psophocarpus tetragonolobus]|uniref:Uncharacterized protein n=1 Tax=Psophocarpus tetragonolobus TaxID=3891 RepID=A0AAN9T4J4_PSOTE
MTTISHRPKQIECIVRANVSIDRFGNAVFIREQPLSKHSSFYRISFIKQKPSFQRNLDTLYSNASVGLLL